MTFTTKIATSLTALALASTPFAGALASGTMGGGKSAMSSARMGQSVYARKVACKSCMYPGGVTKETAEMALMKIENGQIMLSANERSAVASYINRRFKGM